MESILLLLNNISLAVWGSIMPVLLFGTHLFFTIRLRFVQRHIGRGIRLSMDSGDSSGFRTLTATLAATLGTGNIVGISTAVALGGAGAVFWCWLTGLFGMATTYAETFLGLRFQKTLPDNSRIAGPMCAFEEGLHLRTPAVVYSVFLLLSGLGMCCATSSVVEDILSGFYPSASFLWPCIAGMLTAVLLGFIINGGGRVITSVCMRLVPAMAVFYFAGCAVLLFLNRNKLLPALALIIKSAFGIRAFGAGVLGGSLKLAMRYGIARGLFTNEAGLGSAAVAASETKADAESQSLISMSATFWDTVVMCGVTGLVIVSSFCHFPEVISALDSGELVHTAFSVLPFGRFLLNTALFAFAVATLIGWYYIAEKAVLFLNKKSGRPVNAFRLIYIVFIFLGFVLSLELVFELSDLFNAVLIFAHLPVLFLLKDRIQAPGKHKATKASGQKKPPYSKDHR